MGLILTTRAFSEVTCGLGKLAIDVQGQAASVSMYTYLGAGHRQGSFPSASQVLEASTKVPYLWAALHN